MSCIYKKVFTRKILNILKKGNFTEYFYEVFFKLYKVINFNYLSPREVLCVQSIILQMLEKLKSTPINSENKREVEDIVFYFRSLVNNILCKYFFEGEMYYMSSLTTKSNIFSDYEYKNVKYYIEIADAMLLEDKGRYVVITDLCVGNIQAGDIIVKNNSGVSFIEIKKPSKHNDAILDSIINEKPIKLCSEYDKKQYERLKRQKERFDEIEAQISLLPLNIGEYGVTYPLLDENIKTYKRKLLIAIKMARYFVHNIIKVDSIVTIHTINNARINIYEKEILDSVALKRMRRYSCICISNRRIIENTKYFLANIGENTFEYNVCIDMPYAPQPYIYKIPMNIIKKLYYRDLQIFISIDFEALFDKMKQLGYKVYKKKSGDNKLFRYKNSCWYFEKNDTKGFIGNAIVERIVFGLYTSNDYVNAICDYHDRFNIDFLEEVSEQEISMK